MGVGVGVRERVEEGGSERGEIKTKRNAINLINITQIESRLVQMTDANN